jgi:hypothetical protein
MLFTKREAAEIMLRPMPMPDEIHQKLMDTLLHNDVGEFIAEFRKSTHLILLPAGNDLFTIKY